MASVVVVILFSVAHLLWEATRLEVTGEVLKLQANS